MKGTKSIENNEGAERAEGKRAGFVRLFERYDFRNEEHFLRFAKWLIFILLVLVETLVLLQRLDGVLKDGGWWTFYAPLGIAVLLTLSMGIKLFALKQEKRRAYLYIFDGILATSFLFFVGSWYPFTVYILILTPVYFDEKRMKESWVIFAVSILLYMFAYAVQAYIQEGEPTWNLLLLGRLTFGFILGITAHFLLVQIVLAFYRQYLKLDKALTELSDSKKELEKAYAVVAEVSALQERQRIAKEIHDTVGHSLTTVIMQTEAAKRIVASNPTEAENKLISANLRARQALEEIRSGVHLLSGAPQRQTLQRAFLDIIHESTDGTGIIIRSDIAEVEASTAKERFLCNTLKEGISNGLRHGGATAFWVELKETAGQISFLLSDNGKGQVGESLQKGFGLTTMEERARALGGEITFFSEEGEGFEIRLTLPSEGGKV